MVTITCPFKLGKCLHESRGNRQFFFKEPAVSTIQCSACMHSPIWHWISLSIHSSAGRINLFGPYKYLFPLFRSEQIHFLSGSTIAERVFFFFSLQKTDLGLIYSMLVAAAPGLGSFFLPDAETRSKEDVQIWIIDVTVQFGCCLRRIEM